MSVFVNKEMPVNSNYLTSSVVLSTTNLLSVNNLTEPVTHILLEQKNVIHDIDTSLGDVTIVLTPEQIRVASIGSLILHNTTGENNIELRVSADEDSNTRARILQEILNLQEIGSSTLIRVIRTGNGIASVTLEGFPIVQTGDLMGHAIVQVIENTQYNEFNRIQSILNAGPIGDTGPTGPQGEKGDTGPIGPQGEKGTDGIIGRDGDTGPTGPQGEKGDTGPIGPQGEKGADGIIGRDGDTGPTGPQGEKGADGSFLSTFPDGSVATPSISFTNDTNTGFYRKAEDMVGVAGKLVVSGNVGIGNTNPLQSLHVSGNLIAKDVPILLGKYHVTTSMIEINLNQGSSTINSIVFTRNVPYFVTGGNSRIMAEVNWRYQLGGSGKDDIHSRLYIKTSSTDTTVVAYGFQKWEGLAGGGTRSNTIFPLIGALDNVSTVSSGEVIVEVQVGEHTSGASDDTITLYGTNINAGANVILVWQIPQ